MAAQSNYQLLIQKLDQFIRKYYINKVIRGALYSIGFVLLLFLVVDLLIYYNDFGTGTRTGLFFSFVGLSLAALAYWVVLPLTKYFRLGTVISHEQAASIIGEHFIDVKDKLLNILQLKRQSDSVGGNDLTLAGIDQKSEEIKLVPFKSAINLSHNRKYLRYALPPLLLLIILLFAAPSMIKDGTERLVRYGKEFVKPAPFRFELENEELSVVQYGDFPLTVKVEGEQLPAEVFIDLDNVQYRLKKQANNLFTYKFSNVQKDVDFKLYAAEVKSSKYKLEVLKKPNMLGFEVKLNYPEYTGRKDEELNSVGDLVVPVGTTIDWVFNAENTDDVQIDFSREANRQAVKRFSNDLFTYKRKVMQDDIYKLYISNKALPNADSITYSLSVIPDLYPEITVENFQDSLDNKLIYFVGEASDDYGMQSLSFNYRISKEGNPNEAPLETLLIQAPDAKQVSYEHIFDLNELNLQPGDEVTYYFEVFDNDAVNGSKSSRTNLMVYAKPTVDEFEAMAEENDEQIMDNLEKARKESKDLQEEMKRLREKLLQEKELDWQNRKELENLLQRQKELEEKIKEAQQAFEENLKNQSEYEEPTPEEQEKQEKLQELFEESMSPEMKELMEKLEEMLQEMDKEEAMEMMEQMEFNEENTEMNLERLEELYKQLELEQEMNKALDKLNELAEEQEKLAEETEKLEENQDQQDAENQNKEGEQKEGENQEENKEGEQKENKQQEGEQKEGENQENKEEGQQKQEGEQQDQENQEGEQQSGENQEEKPKQEEIVDKQKELNEKFQELQEKMDGIKEKNEQLENKQDMGDSQEQMDDINRDMQESQQQLQQQQNKKASESQKKAAQKMRQMSQQMSGQMQSGQMQQMQEDMESLRQLLENLVGLSFEQEDLIDNFDAAEVNTPRYVDLVQDQFKIKDDFSLVEDSLRALSKRVFQIETFVTEKVTEINENLDESIDELEERRKAQAGDHQQRTMKNLNDLALMLSETMNQMQQQMAGMMSGSQMCNKPSQGQGQQPQDKISQGQQKLNQEMQQKGKQGGQGGENPGLSSEEFAKLAARQAALRKALEEKQKQLREQGRGSKELQDAIDEMDKVEIDLVNKQLRNETMKRQQEILTRLLRHEKAERQREYDQKRKSEVAQEQEKQLPPALEEYIKKRKAELELYKTVSPSLKPYYKNLVEEYFKELKTGEGGR
ncbi:MAG TPA: DUF4175 family protein [Saprospiraceae bacterium]|nr:DUF4175 family protein [Saprospiraceae bacterium]